jgi:hypothetical protein
MYLFLRRLWCVELDESILVVSTSVPFVLRVVESTLDFPRSNPGNLYLCSQMLRIAWAKKGGRRLTSKRSQFLGL